jgi:TolB-like protein
METVKKIPHEEIITELESVLKFNALRNSPILSKFLRHVVEETLNERQHLIKEYSIAVHVLNRSSDFNSNDDAVVRIHAGRLRRILNEYYLTQGQNNFVKIEIPKGCYIPHFIRHENLIHPILQYNNTNPVIAIFPFKSITQKESLEGFSEILCEELSAELSLFKDISVRGFFSKEMIAKIDQNVLEAAKIIGADFIITGHLQCNDKKIQIRVNLLNVLSGEYVMTKSFDPFDIRDIYKVQSQIVQKVVCAVGGYYGIIFKEIIKNSSDNSEIWKGIYNYYKYQCSYSLENCLSAFTNLKEATITQPNHALIWAMMGEFCLDGIAFTIEDSESVIEEGFRCIMKSLKIDPNCQHAWHALTWANLFKRDSEACLYSAQQCITINPNASGLVSGVGCMLIFAGYFDKGFSIMNNAIEKNPNYPWWMNIGFCYYYIVKKEYTTALYWAEKMDSEETFWDPLLKAATLSFTNQDFKAKKYLSKLLRLEPETPKRIKSMLSSYILTDNITMDIITSLEKIGLETNFNY